MRTIICIGLILSLVLGLGSCSLIDNVKEQVNNIGNEIGIDLSNDKLQELFNQGLEGLDSLLNQGVIEAKGESGNNEANMLHVHDDKIVITVNTDSVRAKMAESKVTVDSIKAERANAETAKMDYTLQYQYAVSLKINGNAKIAVCYATITEDTLENTVTITLPIAPADIGVTIYELLQGGSIQIESCLQHGTDTTKAVKETYYLNKIPEGKSGNLFTMEDHRSK